MNKPAIFNFIVEKDDLSITVERSFHAPLDPVWAAWTEADILCKWWTPKPYKCVIKSLDLREGGRWLYCMVGPEGDRHWCFFDHGTITPKTYYSGNDSFCDEHGVANTINPATIWENHFSENDGSTLVRCHLRSSSAEGLEQTMQMGFREGFNTGLYQLDELLTSGK